MPVSRLRFYLLSIFILTAVCACARMSGPGTASSLAPERAAEQSDANLSAQAGESTEDFEERARKVFGTRSLAREGAGQGLDGDLLYKFLLGEIATQRGDFPVAAKAFLDLAKSTRDPRLARRATEVALFGRLHDQALEAARIWLEGEPQSTPARQTLAALYVGKNDLRSAKPLLQEMLARDSESLPQALLQLNALLGKHADKNAVQALVRELAAPYSKMPEAHYALAQAAFAAGKSAEALTEVREALRLRPQWESGALFQAQILAAESKGKALDYLKAYLSSHPAAQEVRLTYARQLIGDKQLPQAREQFQQLLRTNPENGEIAVTVALLSLQIGDLDAAESQLQRVLQMNYKDPDAIRFHLGQVAEERKRLDAAAQWYLSVQGGEQYVVAHARYAFLLAKQNRIAQAREHLQKLPVLADGQRIQIVQSEAQLMREMRAYEDSYVILQTALDKEPDHPELLYDVALAAEKANRLEVVETSLKRLIAIRPDHAQAYNALGYTLADRTERFAEAREYIVKALQLAPDDPFILDSMGWVEYRMGRLAAGLDFLQRAFRQRQDPEIAAHLGEVLWAKGQKQEAERVWRDSLRDNPENEELQKTIRKFLP